MTGPGPRFHVDEDLRRATTPPPWVYRDDALFAESRARLFARTWQLVGDLERLGAGRRVLPVTLLPGMLDEPLVLARDDAGALRCLSNVCTHRGNLVCEAAGEPAALRCRYHGRRFGLDGRFRSMPEFEQALDFPGPSDDLPRVPHDTWLDFVFAGLRPEAPFADWLGPAPERCAAVGLVPGTAAGAGPRLAFDATRSRDYEVRAHWALYVENYLEGFHIPFVHAGLHEALDYGSYRTETWPWGVLQTGIARDGEPAFDAGGSGAGGSGAGGSGAGDGRGGTERIAALYFWLWPNTMLNVYPWGISVNLVQPLAPDRTRVSFLSYVADAARLEQGAGAATGLDRVELEDEAVVENVQRGMRSLLYRGGRYSPTREQGVHHFHRLLARALA